ncbi:MAG: chemotaxis protein CheW [Bacteroidota bacterium]
MELQNVKKQTESILRERAKKLAAVASREEDSAETLEFLQFSLADEQYGLETNAVSEVLPMQDLTPLPCTPDYVLGLFNARGKIVTVIDIKKIFGVPGRGPGEMNKLIIVSAAGLEVGILADTIRGIQTIPFSDLQRDIPALGDQRERYLKGITRQQTVLLDIHRLLFDEQIIVDHKNS